MCDANSSNPFLAYFRPPGDGLVWAQFALIVHRPGLDRPEGLVWCNLEGGVVAYRHPQFDGSPRQACDQVIARLRSGTDGIAGTFVPGLDWVPVPSAPMSLQPIAQEYLTMGGVVAEMASRPHADRVDVAGPVQASWSQFVDTLNPDVLTMLSGLPGSYATCENYNLFVHEEPERTRWRQQAFLDSVLLVRLAARPFDAGWRSVSGRPSLAQEILAIVDGGLPLHRTISQRLGVSEAVWRRCKNLTLDFVSPEDIPTMLRQFSAHLPPENYPDSEDEAYLQHLWHWLGHLRLPRHRLLVPVASRLGKRIHRELKIFGAEIGWYADQGDSYDPHDAPPSIDVVRDFIGELLFRRLCAFPSTAQLSVIDREHDVVRHSVAEWLVERGVRSFIQEAYALRKLNSLRRYRRTASGGMAELEHWFPLLKGPFSFEHRFVIELSNTPALEAEGAAMNNCVGAYTRRCFSGLRVFSVRDQDGNRLATLALAGVERDTDLWFEIDELRGDRNSAADPASVLAALALVKLANASALKVRRMNILYECRLVSTPDRSESAFLDANFC